MSEISLMIAISLALRFAFCEIYFHWRNRRLMSYLLFLQRGCDEGSRLRTARVAQAPVEEYRKDAAFLESLIKPAAASNHRRKHRRLQLPARR